MLQELKKLARTMAKTISDMGYAGMNHRHCLDVIAKTGGMKNWQAVVALKDRAKPVLFVQDEILTCDEPGETDFTLKPGVLSCWITVDGFSVYLKRTDEGVVVDVFALGCDDENPIGSTYAFHDDAEAALCEHECVKIDDVSEWVGLHYKVNFDAESGPKRHEWIRRYIKSYRDDKSTLKRIHLTGYYKDDHTEFSGYVGVIGEDQSGTEDDDDVFYYFDGSCPIIGGHGDFVVTSYVDAEGVVHHAHGLPGDFESILDVFEKAFSKGGLQAVENLAATNGISGRVYCKPCEADMPAMHNTCLCCGTSASTGEGTSEQRKEVLDQVGYAFHVSDFKRPYWERNGEASDDFDSTDICIDDAWQNACKLARGYRDSTDLAWNEMTFDAKVVNIRAELTSPVSRMESGNWYVISSYDAAVLSGPHGSEEDAQTEIEIDTDLEQAGGVTHYQE